MNFLDKPSTDFNAVRDGRRSLPFWLDIDLTNARSIAAGSALAINIAGNSFYVDQDTTNVGNAIVHFQDTNLGNASAPLFVSAGFIANVPFTQILIENAAQAGKRLRIFYGVDIDFQAGINASISISGTVNIGNAIASPAIVQDGGKRYTNTFYASSALAAATAETIVAPGTNVNGIVVLTASADCFNAAGQLFSLIAKTSAPVSVSDGDILAVGSFNGNSGGSMSSLRLEAPIYVPPGKGLYFICLNADTTPVRSRQVVYRLL